MRLFREKLSAWKKVYVRVFIRHKDMRHQGGLEVKAGTAHWANMEINGKANATVTLYNSSSLSKFIKCTGYQQRPTYTLVNKAMQSWKCGLVLNTATYHAKKGPISYLVKWQSTEMNESVQTCMYRTYKDIFHGFCHQITSTTELVENIRELHFNMRFTCGIKREPSPVYDKSNKELCFLESHIIQGQAHIFLLAVSGGIDPVNS